VLQIRNLRGQGNSGKEKSLKDEESWLREGDRYMVYLKGRSSDSGYIVFYIHFKKENN